MVTTEDIGLTVYGSFSLVESLSDKFLYWCPCYYHIKFAFLVWLQLPSGYVSKSALVLVPPGGMQQGAGPRSVGQNVIWGGGIMASVVGEEKFVSNHQGEIQLVKAVVLRCAMTGKNTLRFCTLLFLCT
ncbi:hypothetical protein GW17_00001958 [Ensete ventricosum]|nr:hypothetical protein GW17_00001958 [Ensete ventricosum]RZR88567.1 hypothetical protein BHM03_00016175 [Ensete ventricosum]